MNQLASQGTHISRLWVLSINLQPGLANCEDGLMAIVHLSIPLQTSILLTIPSTVTSLYTCLLPLIVADRVSIGLDFSTGLGKLDFLRRCGNKFHLMGNGITIPLRGLAGLMIGRTTTSIPA